MSFLRSKTRVWNWPACTSIWQDDRKLRTAPFCPSSPVLSARSDATRLQRRPPSVVSRRSALQLAVRPLFSSGAAVGSPEGAPGCQVSSEARLPTKSATNRAGGRNSRRCRTGTGSCRIGMRGATAASGSTTSRRQGEGHLPCESHPLVDVHLLSHASASLATSPARPLHQEPQRIMFDQRPE